VHIIYAIDASGSMKGKKIEMAKKAGSALAYKGIDSQDKIGLIVFGSDVKEEIAPCSDFPKLLSELVKIKASKQTDFKGMLHSSLDLFAPGDFTKHLIILTDAMPTVGSNPQEESLHEVGKIRNAGITVSLIGINLDNKAEEFARRVAEVGEGNLYLVRETDELDTVVLEDYYSVR
jgi:Mg-chelatase subunit ChlD